MAKKGSAGFVHLLPLLIITFMLVGSFTFLAFSQEKRQKEAVGKVLSSSDSGSDHGGSSGGDSSGPSSGDDHGGSSGSSGSSSSGGSAGTSQSSSNSSSSQSSSGSSGNVRIDQRQSGQRTKIETKPDETKVEIRNGQGRFETKVENNKQETKIRTGNFRIEIKTENGQVVTRVKRENDEEVELENEQENELLEKTENELENRGITLATGSAQLGFIQNGHKVRTNFPLSVNAATGQLSVTTPAGEKAVAILPDVAIANMIAAGVLTRVIEEPTALASPAPGQGTPSATVAGANVQLTALGNKPVFVITGVKTERLLGLVPVDIGRKTVVSAENGQLLDLQEGFLTRLLDLVSI